MSETHTQLAWYGRATALQQTLVKLQGDVDKMIAAQAAKSLRESAKSEAVIVNRHMRQVDTLEQRLRKAEHALAIMVQVMNDCCVPSSFVKDSRAQILEALRVAGEVK